MTEETADLTERMVEVAVEQLKKVIRMVMVLEETD
jgi:hypothetical protein